MKQDFLQWLAFFKLILKPMVLWPLRCSLTRCLYYNILESLSLSVFPSSKENQWLRICQTFVSWCVAMGNRAVYLEVIYSLLKWNMIYIIGTNQLSRVHKVFVNINWKVLRAFSDKRFWKRTIKVYLLNSWEWKFWAGFQKQVRM